MPVYTSHIPSLLNGVSRQVPQLRLQSQGEVQINGYPTLQSGLGKRPPTKYIKNLGVLPSGDDAYYHWINRDSSERYFVKLIDGDLQVFDLAGNQKTVAFPDGKTYLDVVTPDTDFTAITVADYTFIVNKTVTASMSSTLTTALPYDAIINVLAGNYARTYKVIVNGEDENLEQVEAGMAWHYKRYQSEQSATDRVKYSDAEREAKAEAWAVAGSASRAALGIPTRQARAHERA